MSRDEKLEKYLDTFVKMIRMFQGFSDPQIKLVMKGVLSKSPEYLEDLLRTMDVIEMKEELKKFKRSPQKYARRLP